MAAHPPRDSPFTGRRVIIMSLGCNGGFRLRQQIAVPVSLRAARVCAETGRYYRVWGLRLTRV